MPSLTPPAARRVAVAHAAAAFATAPLHIRAMAGPYVGPLLDALHAISRELDALPPATGSSHGCSECKALTTCPRGAA